MDEGAPERARAAGWSSRSTAALPLTSQKELRKIAGAFGREPVWRILDDDARRRPSSWRGAPFLYLFTHAFDWASPVCRGDGKPPAPVCLLPLAFEQKELLYFWESQFDFKCDRCRLVSHLGDSTDGGRHTRIGEFDPTRKANKTA